MDRMLLDVAHDILFFVKIDQLIEISLILLADLINTLTDNIRTPVLVTDLGIALESVESENVTLVVIRLVNRAKILKDNQ